VNSCEMYLVDTNILLEVILSRPRKEPCKDHLRSLQKGRRKGMTTEFTIYSIMIILESFNRTQELRTFLLSLAAYKGFIIHTLTLSELVRAVDESVHRSLTIEDAVQYAAASEAKAEAIISFDKHFDGLDIPRLEPQEAVRVRKTR